jgi:ABC transporter
MHLWAGEVPSGPRIWPAWGLNRLLLDGRIDACDQLALDDVSFDIDGPSITGLLGRNGAGKTTLLRIIAARVRRRAGGGLRAPADRRVTRLSRGMRSALLGDYAEHPGPVMLSTHLIDEVAGLLERVVMTDRGRVVLDATADHLRGEFMTVSGPARAVEAFVAGRTVTRADQPPASPAGRPPAPPVSTCWPPSPPPLEIGARGAQGAGEDDHGPRSSRDDADHDDPQPVSGVHLGGPDGDANPENETERRHRGGQDVPEDNDPVEAVAGPVRGGAVP